MAFAGVWNWQRGLVTGLVSALIALFTLSTYGSQGVSLAWAASTSTNVVGYHVYYGAAPGVYTNVFDAGNSTNATITGLAAGTTYYFAATAYDSSGVESDFSNQAYYSVPGIYPTISAIPNQTVPLNTRAVVPFVVGDAAVAASDLTLSASSGNPTLAPVSKIIFGGSDSNRTVQITPALNQAGIAAIMLTVNDSTGNLASNSFTFTVLSNVPPTLNPLAGVSIPENAGAQTVNLTGISSGAFSESQPLSVTATSSNPGLIPNPTVTYTSPNAAGTLTFAPVLNGFGTRDNYRDGR